MIHWLQLWVIILHGLFGQAVIPFPGTGSTAQLPPSSGMLVWYKADAGNNCGGVACTDGANQDTWADQSGNSNTGLANGTRRIAAGFPLCIQGVYHTNQINGQPAVTFNGNLTTPTCFPFTNAVTLTTASTAFAVAKTTNTGAYGNLMGGDQGGMINWELPSLAKPSLIRVTNNCNVDLIQGNAAINSNWNQVNYTYNNVTINLRLNRASDGSASPSSTITQNESGIGGTACGSFSAFTGQMAEIIIYNRVLSGTEITNVETYLNAKYGL